MRCERAVPDLSTSQVRDVRYQYLLDSGNHLGHATPYRDTITNLQPVTGLVGRSIDGGRLNVTSQGSIPGNVNDVYIIDSIEHPALSIQQLAQRGFTTVFPALQHGGGATVYNLQNEIVAKAGNDYIIDIKQAKLVAAIFNHNDPPGISIVDKVKLLQTKLRGLSKQTVIDIANGLVDNFPCTAEDIRSHWVDDGSYTQGTMPMRTARHRPKNYNRGQPGDNVHFDGFTVSVPAILHRYNVCTLFVDRATLFLMVQFGHTTDTAKDIAQKLWRVHKRYRRHGHKVRNMQSDNLSTYTAQEVQDAALAMGFTHTLKAPYLKESLEESMVHALKIIIIVSFAAAPYMPPQVWLYAAVRGVIIINFKPVPWSKSISRFFAFTGVKPDWARTPLADFGAPFIVAKHKETRQSTWDGHGEWAAYLCPCLDSLPEVHFFLLMQRNRYQVVRRGAYRHQATVPDQWWLDLPDQSRLQISVESGNVWREIDTKAFDGVMDVHFPYKGLSESWTQTDTDSLSQSHHRDSHIPVIQHHTDDITGVLKENTELFPTTTILGKRLHDDVDDISYSPDGPSLNRRNLRSQGYNGLSLQEMLATPLAAALMAVPVQTDALETTVSVAPATASNGNPQWCAFTEDSGLITHNVRSEGKQPRPGESPTNTCTTTVGSSSSDVGPNTPVGSPGDDERSVPEHRTVGASFEYDACNIKTDKETLMTIDALKKNLLDTISSLASEAQPPPDKRQLRICAIMTATKKIIFAAKKAGGKRTKGGYAGDNPTLSEALKSPERDEWVKAIEVEINQLDKKESWLRLMSLPKGAQPIPSHFVLKRKRLADGSVAKYKARLVANGAKQLSYMYEKTFAPTANAESIKLIYNIAAKQCLYIRMFDVVGAYLLADLKDVKDPIYMVIPSILNSPQVVVELKKSLYGLKQAGHLFNKLLDKALKSVGLIPTCDPCVYTLERGQERVIVGIHVDDCLFASSSNELVDDIVKQLEHELHAELEEVTETGSHLGISVTRNENMSITMTQPGYIDRMAHALNLQDGDQVDTPLPVNEVIPDNASPADITDYQQVLGLLMYAACHTRPDISYAVSLLATRVSKPTIHDLTIAYRVVRYLYTTRDLGLTFSADGAVTMYGYVDAAYNLHPDAKGHTGILLTLGLGDAPFCHRSKKQSTVARSSTESEYAAVDTAVLDIEFFRRLLHDLGYRQDHPTTVFQDNMSTITVLQSENYTARTKHYAMRYHYIRQAVEEQSIVFEYLPTHQHTADIMTKAIGSRQLFFNLRAQLLNCQPTPSGI